MLIEGGNVHVRLRGSIPLDYVGCYSTCKEMEREITRFWWRGNKKNFGMHWIVWEKLKRRKEGADWSSGTSNASTLRSWPTLGGDW